MKTELVFVFREERGEVEGLKAIKKKRKTKYTLLTDLGSKKTTAYSGKRGQFATYVLDKKGTVRAILDGSKPKRPPADAIIKAINSFDKTRKKSGSGSR